MVGRPLLKAPLPQYRPPMETLGQEFRWSSEPSRRGWSPRLQPPWMACRAVPQVCLGGAWKVPRGVWAWGRTPYPLSAWDIHPPSNGWGPCPQILPSRQCPPLMDVPGAPSLSTSGLPGGPGLTLPLWSCTWGSCCSSSVSSDNAPPFTEVSSVEVT